MAQKINRQPPWSITALDKGVDDELHLIEGLLPATSIEESGETGIYASLGIPGRRLPITQYVRGESQTFSFEAFYINDPTVDTGDGRRTVSSARNLLKRTVAPYRSLGRPIKYAFNLGETITFACFVESIGSISYSDVLTHNNEPLHASFSIRLRIIADRDRPGFEGFIETLKALESYVMKLAETFEEVGAAKYEDPLMGVVLRQQSKVAFPGSIPREKIAERRVKLLDSWDIQKFGVKPASPALQLTNAKTSAAVFSLYATRGNQLQPDTAPGAALIQQFQLPTP